MSTFDPSPSTPAQIARQLAAQPALWQPLVRYDAVERYYVRLAQEPVEAWLLTWLPGQGTEWHDHGGSAGAFAVVQGTLTERQASTRAGEPPRIRPGARTWSAGAVRPFGSRHLHRVVNSELTPAVSVHVYAPALSEMRSYEPRGDVLELVAARLAGTSW